MLVYWQLHPNFYKYHPVISTNQHQFHLTCTSVTCNIFWGPHSALATLYSGRPSRIYPISCLSLPADIIVTVLTAVRFRKYKVYEEVYFSLFTANLGARSSAVGQGTAIQARRSRVRFPMVSLEFFVDSSSGRAMALGLTQPLTEINTRNICWG